MTTANNVCENFKVNDITNSQDPMTVVRLENLPILSSGAGSSDFSSSQFINIPVLQEGSVTNAESPQSYILATSSDGNTILVDASQLAMLSEQTIPLYDGTNLFQLASQTTSDAVVEDTPETAEDQTNNNDSEKVADKTPFPDDDIQPPDKKGSQKCNICYETFASLKLLQRHYKVHAEDKPHHCDECDVSFNNLSNLLLHKATHSTSDLKCPECGRNFSRLASLKSHLKLHETEENLICPECGDEFVTQFKLDKHLEDHAKELVMDKSFVCRHCSKAFQKLIYLKEHTKMHYKIKASLNRRQYRKFNDRSKFPHKCYFCGKQFQKPSQLIRHNRIHTGERPYKCDVCNRAFSQKNTLLTHKVKHTGERPYVCEFCPASFAQKGNLRNHIHRVHTLLPMGTAEGVHKCELCNCVFKKLGSLNAHMSRAHSSSTVNFIDTTKNQDENAASEVTDVVQQLIEMSKEVKTHDLNKESFEKIVVDSSVSADILQQALVNSGLVSTEQSGRSKPYVMTVEDTATGTLRKHIIRNVGGVRWYQCMYCTKEFKKPSDLVRHIRIHTHERPFKCNQCFRSFAVKNTLNAHIRTHSGTKEFSCEHCKKLFSTSGSLKVHLLLHTGVKPFSCTICDKTFRTSGHRNSHVASHQKEKTLKRTKKAPRVMNPSDPDVADIPLQEPILITNEGLIQSVPKTNPLHQDCINGKFSSDRPYRCYICEKAFKKSSHLKQHIRSHTGEKPYTCQQCQKSFVANGVLKSHMRIHTGTKAYKCAICEAAFTTKGSLTRHTLMHTNERPYMCPYCQKTYKTVLSCRKHMQSHRYELALGLASGVSVTVMSDGVIGVSNPLGTSKETLSRSEQKEHPSVETRETVVVENANERETILNETANFMPEEEILPEHLTQEVYNSATGMIAHIEVISQNESFTQNENLFSIEEPEFDGNHLTLQPDSETELVTSHANNENIAHENLSDLLQQEQETIVESTDSAHVENIEIPKPKEPRKQKFKKPFKCEQCSKTFKKTSHLKQHILSHTGEKSFWCTICGDMFSHNRVLKQHIKTKHEGIKDFKCSICNSSFTSNYNLLRHMNTHDSGYPFHCAYCSLKFVTKDYYKIHLNDYHQISEKKDEIFNNVIDDQTPIEVYEAIEVQVSNNDAPENILVKTINDDTSQNLIKNVVQVANNIGLAEKLFMKTLNENKNNNKSVSGDYNPKQIHQCSQCPKSFKKPSDLVRHLRIHTGEKPYSCESCGKSFTVKSTLISHQKTHTGEKNFACHICNSLFATKGSLKIHMRLHTGARPFKCPHCELYFRTSGHRKSHMASHFKDRSNKKRKQVSITANELASELNGMSSAVVSLGEDVVNVFQSDTCTELPTITSDNFQISSSLFNPNVQLTTIDPNTLLTKPLQIDAATLQQLQALNFNITINPTINEPQLLSKPSSDTSQGQQIISIEGNAINSDGTLTINPNMIIQSLGFTVASQPQTDLQNSENLTLIIPGTSLLKNTTGNIVQDGDLLEAQVLTVSDNTKDNSEFLDSNKTQEVFLNTSNISNCSDIDYTSSTETETGVIHVCSICNKTFKTLKQLNSHAKAHKKEYSYHCEICNTSFRLKTQLIKHLTNSHKVKS